MKSQNPKKLLSVSEVSEYLCIPLKSVYYLTQTGKIKGIKIGKHWRYHLKDIEDYYQNGTARTKQPAEILTPAQETTYRTERRRFPRINCNLGCGYEINIPSLKQFSCTGSIRNISGNGIFLHSQPNDLRRIFPGDPVNLDFYFPEVSGKRININVSGRIITKVAEGVGIKFRSIDKQMRRSITRFVG